MPRATDDILVELTNDEIEEFRVFYKNCDLELVYVHLYLKNQLRWNQKMLKMSDREVAQISDRCKMKFYKCRDGVNENKTLIGITGDQEYSIFVVTVDESMSELRECLMSSAIIKWDQLPLFVALHRRFHVFLYEIIEAKGVRVRLDNYCSTIWMGKEKSSSYEYSVPDDVEMRPLCADDCRVVDEPWPYKYPGSENFIRSIILLNDSLGIYKNDKLVSWILQVESFGLGMLQTLDEHQGKGYARLLTRAMTERIGQVHGEDIVLFASYGKPKTVDLYIRYGFKHVSYTHWLYLKRAE